MGSGPAGRVEFTLGRRRRAAPAGMPLAATLTGVGAPILQRSIRYHRPRAPFCGTGACTNCLVRVNGVPNVRACRYAPAPGDRIEFENAWPSPNFDLLGILDTLFPGGIDSVRGFRRPAFARPAFQWVVRHLAAYGALPDPPRDAPAAPTSAVRADAIVVGAGTAGRSVAAHLVARGLRPILIDRDAIPSPPAGVDARPGFLAAFLPPPSASRSDRFELLAVDRDGSGWRISTSRVAVATGSYDAGLWFPNSDRPGVLTAEGAEALAPSGGPAPFARGLLFGGGDRAAGLLDRWGDRFEAVAAPGPIAPAVARRASELEIPLYPRSLLVTARGRRRVRSVSLASRGGGPKSEVPVDAIVLAHRRLPNNPILFQVGARLGWQPSPGAYFPRRNGPSTSVAGLCVVGDVAGPPSPPGNLDPDARAAADRLLDDRPWPERFPDAGPALPGEMEGYYRELLALRVPRPRWVACACEDVGLAELRDAHHRGYRGIEVIKRYTGLGTGLCQGRYCLPEALIALSVWEGRPPSEVGYITQRPPVMPVPLEGLAALPEGSEGP